jgi:hypothetical protein
MKKIIAAVVVGIPLLVGCETMMAHYRMNEPTIKHIAWGNAAVNVCLAHNAIDRNMAYAYSSVSAQLLDISVLDREFYKLWYQDNVNRFSAHTDNVQQDCAGLQQGLGKVTTDYAALYMKISSELAMARAQERQQMTAMLSNFGSNWAQPVVPVAQTWPAVTYASVQPTGYNFLVKTNNGLINCRTTDKNFVFCM